MSPPLHSSFLCLSFYFNSLEAKNFFPVLLTVLPAENCKSLIFYCGKRAANVFEGKLGEKRKKTFKHQGKPNSI